MVWGREIQLVCSMLLVEFARLQQIVDSISRSSACYFIFIHFCVPSSSSSSTSSCHSSFVCLIVWFHQYLISHGKSLSNCCCHQTGPATTMLHHVIDKRGRFSEPRQWCELNLNGWWWIDEHDAWMIRVSEIFIHFPRESLCITSVEAIERRIEISSSEVSAQREMKCQKQKMDLKWHLLTQKCAPRERYSQWIVENFVLFWAGGGDEGRAVKRWQQKLKLSSREIFPFSWGRDEAAAVIDDSKSSMRLNRDVVKGSDSLNDDEISSYISL